MFFTRHISKERRGEIMIFLGVICFSLFPLIISEGVEGMSRILFLGITNFLAAPLFLLYLLILGRQREILSLEAWKHILAVTVYIVIIPSIFIALGAARTDGISTAIFTQAELFFTFIICGFYFHEKVTFKKVAGAAVTLLGATIILLKGSPAVNIGALLIVLGTLSYPFGNIHAKKAMKTASPGVILFWRSLIGGPVLVLVALLTEARGTDIWGTFDGKWLVIGFTTFAIFFISKIFFYEGIRRIEITEATAINLSVPAFSILFAILIFHTFPTAVQAIGLALIIMGLYFITRKDGRMLDTK